ncbi:MAG: O-antigen ligase family protein [Anaerolineae bacterium]
MVLGLLVGWITVHHPLPVLGILTGCVLIWAIGVTPLSVLTLLLILSPLRTLIATEANLALPLDIGQMLFIGLVVMWWWHAVIRHEWHLHLPHSPIFWAVALFTVVISWTTFSALSMQFWLTEWLKWVTVLVMIVLVIDLGQQRNWELMLIGLIGAGIGNAGIGLYIFFGGSGADHLLINEQFFRAFGTFGQPNPFGGFLGLLIPLAIMSTYGYGSRLWRTWEISSHIHPGLLLKLLYYGTGSFVMIAGLIASWSRGAWLGFVVSMAVIAFCLPRRLWQSLLLSGIAIVLVAGLWFSGFIPVSIQQRLLSSTEELLLFSDVRGVDITTSNYAIVERLAHWQAAINMAQENPWWGIGFGNYEVAYAEYRLINWNFPLGHAHNYYLNILGEAGMIGFLFYMGMWFTIVVITWFVRCHPDVLIRSLSVGMLGSWSYLAFHSLLDNLYVNNIFLHLGLMLGFIGLFYQKTQSSILWGTYVSNNNQY